MLHLPAQSVFSSRIERYCAFPRLVSSSLTTKACDFESIEEGILRGTKMIIRRFGLLALAAALTMGLPALAQDTGAKQDLKNAGTDTKNATKDVGHGVKQGTTKAYDKTTSGTKTVADKTVNGTKTGAKDVGHGTKVAADKTADVSKDAAHSTANGTKKVVNKVDGKPATPPSN
jgi:hypothetical protein